MACKERLLRRKLHVTGVVQGVGFRPFIYRLAQRHAITGWVRNTSGGVEIDAEGSPESLEAFAAAIRTEAPELARVDSVAAIEAESIGHAGFHILESETTASVDAVIPADASTCPDCFEEIADSSARRHCYPFTNCCHWRHYA